MSSLRPLSAARQGLGMLVLLAWLVLPGVALATGPVAWSVSGVALPSQFVPGGAVNRYQLLVTNTGDTASLPGVTITDHLPAGLTATTFDESQEGAKGEHWKCGGLKTALATCTLKEALPAGEYAPPLEIGVSSPTESAVPLENRVSVSEGGAPREASASESTLVGSAEQPFRIVDFSVEARNADGSPSVQAGGHPWEVTTSLGFPWAARPANELELNYAQVHNVKKIVVELPAGMAGNLLSSTEHCTEVELQANSCPPGSKVGQIAFAYAGSEFAVFRTSSPLNNPSAVYDMTPDPGYPAQLGFSFLNQPLYLYASVVHAHDGEHVRLTTVAVPPIIESGTIVLTLWGEPGAFNESGTTGALITNPTSCSKGPQVAKMEAESWGEPGKPVFAEATVYPEINGCEGLLSSFTPEVALNPLTGEGALAGTTQADAPSGFEGVGKVTQTLGFEENAVPHVRDASVVMPPGLSINPAAGQGLTGCKERGPEGINLGTEDVGTDGADKGNSEATEFGAGHAGGNGSPYDDAQYHTAPGHCPDASIVGSVEVFTPLLATRCGGAEQLACVPGESPAPLEGHVFIAQPKCGGEGQAACMGSDAEDGRLFTGYVELSGDGVLIKESAKLAVSQATGQMELQLHELPQFPFSEVRVRTEGGNRAPLENPQTCGAATTRSALTPWSAAGLSEVFSPTPSSFAVDANGAGGPCPSTWPFAPGFTGGSVSTAGGGSTAFTTSLTRQDREQNVTGLSASPPVGLLAMLSNVTPCLEPQAASGECPESGLIGHDTAGVGAGPDPFYASGKVYLTGPYKGAPFGLDVVTPAVAGPFNLGNVVVRATINVNPSTAQVTITSDPIPQFRFGVPLRLKALNITIDKEHFVINPTNCSQLQYTGTATGNQGAAATLSVPFAATGCASLPFKPGFKITTPGKASKHNGAGLTVAFTSTPGQANIKSVKVSLPRQLPSRFATLQKACVDTVFNANPAGCPAGSVIGKATLHTPILKAAMTGPIYIVSHGGAAFPDLVIVLQGEGVTVILDGNTDIKHGITTNTFKAVPDAPFTSFTATFPQGPHSILATYLPAKAKYSLCGQKLNMPTLITAQNNLVVNKTTKITISGCHKPAKHAKTTKHGKH